MKASNYVFGIFVALLLVMVPSIANASVIASAIVDSGTNTSLYFDTSSKSYLDPVSGTNPDVTLRFWSNAADLAGANSDLKNMYVGALYYAGSGNSTYVIITTDNTDDPLTQITDNATSCGTNCWYADAPATSLTFSATKVVNKSGNPGAAWYPANVYAVLSSDDAVSAGDSFLYLNQNSGWLRGSYGTNVGINSYNQSDGMFSFTVNSITGTTTTGSQNIWSTYANRNATFLAVGVCNYTDGSECSDTGLFYPDQSISLDTDIVDPPSNSPVHNIYYVINGIGTQFCIGPDIQVVNFTANNSNPYSGEPVNFTVTLTNGYNVDVDTTFYVRFYYSNGIVIDTQSVASLNKGASTTKSFVTSFTGSGAQTVNVSLDYNDTIKECGEANNASKTVSTAKVYFVDFWVDNVLTNNFSRAGTPYNITIHVNDSDGSDVADAIVKIVEYNDINLFAPTQIWNHSASKRGLVSYSTGEVLTNGSGWVNFTLIPTGNKPLVVQNPEISEYVGNYSMYLELYVSGTKETINYGGNLVDNITLNLLDHTTTTATGIKNVNNQDLVETITNAAYQIYTSILDWLT